MVPQTQDYNQIQNIIQRAQTLILNVKLLGADVTQAKDLLANAKNSLNKKEYEPALQFAMASLKEVMRLKKLHEEGKLEPIYMTSSAGSGESSVGPSPKPASQAARSIPMAEPAAEEAAMAQPAGDHDAGAGVAGVSGASGGEIVSEDGKIYGHEFIEGLSYLIEEGRADKCFVIFQKLMDQEFTGLVITRSNPKIINKRYNLEKGEMLWLTDRESTTEPTIAPSLENMIYVAEEYVDGHEKPLLLLDGIEYLISNNTFNSVLRFLRRLIDKISESEAILLIGVSQGALQDQEVKLLEKELVPIII